MVEQGTQSVVALAQEDVAEWGVSRRHILGQAVELHLQEKVRAGLDARVSVAEGFSQSSVQQVLTHPEALWYLLRGGRILHTQHLSCVHVCVEAKANS